MVGAENDEGDPAVTLELRDSPYTRAMWDFSFHALYKVNILSLSLSLSTFPFLLMHLSNFLFFLKLFLPFHVFLESFPLSPLNIFPDFLLFSQAIFPLSVPFKGYTEFKVASNDDHNYEHGHQALLFQCRPAHVLQCRPSSEIYIVH